ncbi:hypothetical protein QEV13_07475 [Trueperella pyogenes]|uniref:hypothetical protein n=1 Tax=Trueperella pyogenes TaxID=1661 RepID=UPI0024C05BE5|nr:hypothetical protein [Trueperella pyogenes]WHU60487.1 hypothetical protein QEV13_07475 [Trueperella pyogenes]
MENLIAKRKATLTIMAGVLKFSRQAFYTWLDSPVSDRQAQDEEIIAKIRQIHAEDPSVLATGSLPMSFTGKA